MPQSPGYGVAPANNLVWGIFATLCCCLPLGIVSIVKANQVNALWAQGQHDQAQVAANDAKKWAMWAAISGVIAWVLIVGFWVVLFVIGAASEPSSS